MNRLHIKRWKTWILLATLFLSGRGHAETGVWTTRGPDGGPLNAVAVDPDDGSTVYVSANSAGIFKTTDGGASWQARNEGLTSRSIHILAVDPTDPSTLYAGSGSSTDGGFFRSRDGATAWEVLDLASVHPSIRALAIDPDRSATLYLASRGVHRSDDQGETWFPALSGLPDDWVDALVLDPRDPSVLYAAPSREGLYRSDDGAATWARSDAGLVSDEEGKVRALFVDPQTGYVYAATVSRIYRSRDRGSSWEKVADISIIEGFERDPRNSDLYAISPFRLYRGSNQGATWSEQERPSLFLRDLAFSREGVFYLATHCGVLVRADVAAPWQKANTGLLSTHVQALAVDPVDSGVRYAGTHNCGGWRSLDAGASWSPLSGVDFGLGPWALILDPRNRLILYAGSSGGIFKSTDGGRTWVPRQEGLPGSSSEAYLAIAASNPDVLYHLLFNTLFRTRNGAVSWQSLELPPDVWASGLAVDPTDDATVYVGSREHGVLKTTDGGRSWQELRNGLPGGRVDQIATDAADAAIVYALTSRGLSRSLDGGESWRSVGEGFFASTDVESLLSDPRRPATLYAGIDGGVLKSLDRGETWRRVGPEGFTASVYTVALAGSRLLAGTTSGAYELSELCGDRLLPIGRQISIGRGIRGDVAVNASGAFFAVYSSPRGNIVWTRAFDDRGAPLGPRRRGDVNGGQHPRASSDAAGRALIAWQSIAGGTTAVVGRAYDVGGAARGGPFRIDREPLRTKLAPTLGRNRQGDALVLWESVSTEGNSLIRGQRLGAAGLAVGGPFTVAGGANPVSEPAVALDENGRCVVAWLEFHGSGWSVRAQRCRIDGQALGEPLEVRSADARVRSSRPAVAMSPEGELLIAWEELSSSGEIVLRVRWYDDRGEPAGEFQETTDLLSFRSAEATAVMDGSGNSVVAWTAGRSTPNVTVRIFDLEGGSASDEIRIGRGTSPALALSESGRGVVLWDDGGEIVAKRFRLRCGG